MKIKDIFNGEVYDAVVFDGTQIDANPNEDGFQVQVDSPSGDKVEMTIVIGTLILTDSAGKVTVIHPSRIGPQFEEIENG